MPNIKLSSKNINVFIEAMNHRMTSIEAKTGKIENDVKWMKRICYYLATILTGILVKLIFI